jgi:hypothetical protein
MARLARQPIMHSEDIRATICIDERNRDRLSRVMLYTPDRVRVQDGCDNLILILVSVPNIDIASEKVG